MSSMRLFMSLFFVTLSITSHAAPAQYKIDPTHTQIMWFADHLGFSKTVGTFEEFEGDLLLDNKAPTKSMIDITINMDSVHTGVPKLDQHLRNKDFFNTEQFPQARFISKNVTLTGEKTADIQGILTLNGMTQAVTLNVTLNKQGVHPMSKKETVGFTAKTDLQRSKFGITYAIPGIPDIIPIWIEAEAIRVKK